MFSHVSQGTILSVYSCVWFVSVVNILFIGWLLSQIAELLYKMLQLLSFWSILGLKKAFKKLLFIKMYTYNILPQSIEAWAKDLFLEVSNVLEIKFSFIIQHAKP